MAIPGLIGTHPDDPVVRLIRAMQGPDAADVGDLGLSPRGSVPPIPSAAGIPPISDFADQPAESLAPGEQPGGSLADQLAIALGTAPIPAINPHSSPGVRGWGGFLTGLRNGFVADQGSDMAKREDAQKSLQQIAQRRNLANLTASDEQRKYLQQLGIESLKEKGATKRAQIAAGAKLEAGPNDKENQAPGWTDLVDPGDIKTDASGVRWLNASGYKGKELDAVRKGAIKSGVRVVTAQSDVDQLNDINSTLDNLASMDRRARPLLATSPLDVVKRLGNPASAILSLDPRLSSINAFFPAKIRALRAEAGKSGFRMTETEINRMDKNSPNVSLPLASWDSRMAVQREILNNVKSRILGSESAGQKAVGEATNATNGAVPAWTPPPGAVRIQ